MSGSDLHPDFVRCPEERRWRGAKLEALYVALIKEAEHAPATREELEDDRGWHWRILRGGAIVAMRKKPGRMELRIARSGGELTPQQASKWEAEVKVFLKKFRIQSVHGRTPATVPGVFWLELPAPEKERGKAAVRFLSLELGEALPGKALCWGCLHAAPPVERLVEWSPAFGVRGQACNECALARGKALQADPNQEALPLGGPR